MCAIANASLPSCAYREGSIRSRNSGATRASDAKLRRHPQFIAAGDIESCGRRAGVAAGIRKELRTRPWGGEGRPSLVESLGEDAFTLDVNPMGRRSRSCPWPCLVNAMSRREGDPTASNSSVPKLMR